MRFTIVIVNRDEVLLFLDIPFQHAIVIGINIGFPGFARRSSLILRQISILHQQQILCHASGEQGQSPSSSGRVCSRHRVLITIVPRHPARRPPGVGDCYAADDTEWQVLNIIVGICNDISVRIIDLIQPVAVVIVHDCFMGLPLIKTDYMRLNRYEIA